MKTAIALSAVVFAAGTNVLSQGTFQNLGFENAVLVPDPSSSYFPVDVFASSAIPGWTAYIGDASQVDVICNTRPLDAAGISIYDRQSSEYQPLSGNYSVLLLGSTGIGGPRVGASIAQTGQIPPDAQSLSFFAMPDSGGFAVSFAGQALPLYQVGSTAAYNVLAADISAYAGQTGELRFGVVPVGGLLFDDVVFSSTQLVPEPGSLSLVLLGALLGWRFRNRVSTG